MVTVGLYFSALVLPLRFGILSVLSSKKVSVLDQQLVDFVGQVYLRQAANVKTPNEYFKDEAAVTWIEEMKFLIDQLISTPIIDLKKVHKVPLSLIFDEIIKENQF